MNYKKRDTEVTKRIIDAFNRTELREGEKVIDNRDETISQELNLSIGIVRDTLITYSVNTLDKINNTVVEFEEVKPSNHFKLPC